MTGREALDASIAHWAELMQTHTQPTRSEITSDGCALCALYCTNETINAGIACMDCPVGIATGEPGCGGSPWPSAWRTLGEWHADIPAGRRFRQSAERMHDFLVTLKEEAENAGQET